MECNFENCGYYTDGECNICGMGTSGEDTFCRFCKDNPKCYYKQLKRVQQEYVNLSKSFEHLQSSYLENQEYCLQLKAENERLKEELEIRDNLVEHFRKEAINWAKISNDCIKDIEKYKQTLQEIKALVKKNINYQDTDSTTRAMTKILDLITKAEEE